MDLITKITENKLDEAKQHIRATLNKLVREKIEVFKRRVTGAVYGTLLERNVIKQGRTLLIRRRFRRGKLQRNVRKSAIKGFTLRSGKLKRIPVAKRIKMKIVQRRAARKRRAKLQRTLRKRKLTMRKRKAMGIK